jgi:CheY-like chemotaxis protein
MLSHELRNPLAAVLTAARLLVENPQSGERSAAIISRQASHMARLLDDLLDVSRITVGKLGLRKQDIDLRRCVELAIESTSPLLRERAIEVSVHIPRHPLPVRGDPNRLQQVVMNLVSNAANYSQRGSRIDVRAAACGDHAEIRVVDHGMGIEPEMLDRIFELFVQAEQHLDRPRGGLGVGLSLARSIVELHGGTIAAASDGLGRGSEFMVRLPLLPDVETTHIGDAPAKLRPCRIVLVEDQADSREILRMLLEHRDHVVVDASDGAAAVEVIEREHPDAALIDIGLPVMDGYEVAQHVRKHAHLDDVLLVALTGYGAPTDIAAARAAGFDEHVIKPVELARIEEILARRLNRATDQ